MQTFPNDTAFPRNEETTSKGFTKREVIALELMTALIISKTTFIPEIAAKKALLFADAFINALNTPKTAPFEHDNLH